MRKNPAFTPNEMSEAEMNLEDIKKQYAKRKQWFIDRIGQRVYRTRGTCLCSTCKDVAENGLVIADKTHACYLFDCENELGVNYFDTKEETI